ncbi:hypothetical protein PoB_000113600 [Plakobranchus ocellatus]|uniref:Uncharacterized protein n=1 Tax=Plakobranchus ocellatus TaxID=259542 RepID=A0AAV3WXJ6_9GAST|nr:hypothetical protein PoB_000113600 [Plakobranchus ocellatus]
MPNIVLCPFPIIIAGSHYTMLSVSFHPRSRNKITPIPAVSPMITQHVGQRAECGAHFVFIRKKPRWRRRNLFFILNQRIASKPGQDEIRSRFGVFAPKKLECFQICIIGLVNCSLKALRSSQIFANPPCIPTLR